MVKSVSKQRSQRAGLEARDWLPTEVTIPVYKQETEAQSTRQESVYRKEAQASASSQTEGRYLIYYGKVFTYYLFLK